jgi:hypothetical protein
MVPSVQLGSSAMGCEHKLSGQTVFCLLQVNAIETAYEGYIHCLIDTKCI